MMTWGRQRRRPRFTDETTESLAEGRPDAKWQDGGAPDRNRERAGDPPAPRWFCFIHSLRTSTWGEAPL